ncbi:MAG: hypothetical protein CVU38_13690 [Chloroflexi bacterium HGW-Chloroflexi-1]|nr:MAG: hypothetical protein CVU38_13690 [Chloroflexi bacterium HGW-Chloroflexi-1]
MKSIYISDELHRRARLRAAETGVPLKQLVAQWVEQGLSRAAPQTQPPEPPAQLREPVAAYETPVAMRTALPEADAERSRSEALIDDLERRGLLVRGERLREQTWASYLAIRRELGLSGLPSPEPPDLQEIRASFRRQRELYPDVPTVTELIIQMREEE